MAAPDGYQVADIKIKDAYVCARCGVPVADIATHNGWHGDTEKAAGQAARAVRAAFRGKR